MDEHGLNERALNVEMITLKKNSQWNRTKGKRHTIGYEGEKGFRDIGFPFR